MVTLPYLNLCRQLPPSVLVRSVNLAAEEWRLVVLICSLYACHKTSCFFFLLLGSREEQQLVYGGIVYNSCFCLFHNRVMCFNVKYCVCLCICNQHTLGFLNFFK
ncbi:hypothetical protein L2E82_11173 [Cichorium intybus]|uniref:Uncharacterized protein n=1 Tax=Cichorium intybus TaxID=13427 RepID=A0ACB9GCC8_CICIN|nr:hypothetical protein L2E82_11173 [Cichorium intybus]